MQVHTPSTPNGSKVPNRSLAVVVGVTALLVSLAAIAAPHGRHAGAEPQRGFDRIDADGDGAVTRAELNAHIAGRSAALDGNGDGAISFEEAKAYREGRREERARARFQRLDIDGDGRVSTQEALQRQQRVFVFLDRNSDGVVDGDERRQRRPRGG